MGLEFEPSLIDIAHKLDARPNGEGYIACCPAHDDRNPSFTMDEGRNKAGDKIILLNCFAGCSFEEITNELINMGVWPRFIPDNPNSNYKAPRPRKKRISLGAALNPKLKRDKTQSKKELMDYAVKLWKEGVSDMGMCREYMGSRGLSGATPFYARFHKEKSIMMSPIMDWNKKIQGIHRTFLNPDDKGGFVHDKKTLGEMMGGLIFLTDVDSYHNGGDFCVSEGIETGFAWHEATGLNCAAAIAAPNLPAFKLPFGTKVARLLEDNDLPDKKGVIKSMRFYDKLIKSWVDSGIVAYRHRPYSEEKADWLDVYLKDPGLLRHSLETEYPDSCMEGEPYKIEW